LPDGSGRVGRLACGEAVVADVGSLPVLLEISDLRTELIGPVSLCLAAGECVAVLGPSGSGQSLLLRAIADLDQNDGAISVAGRERDRMPAPAWRRLVGLVPAESGWWADRVGDHFSPGFDFSVLLEAVGLPGALEWDVGRLSTGERHRLAVVRALGAAPRALLLDEPTASLDDAATGQVEKLIRAQCADGVPVLMVTHDRDQASRLAQRSFMMERGRLTPMAEAPA
jgi:ABC-type multidrug transport system ATPase subunit